MSGVGGKSTVTRGVPRLQELFHLSKNPKNPSLTIYLDRSVSSDKSIVQRVAAEICLIRISDLVTSSEIVYEIEDGIFAGFNEFNKMFKSLETKEYSSKWALNIYFDKRTLLDKHIAMEEIYYSISKIFKDGVLCEYSDDNSVEMFIRIKIDPLCNELKKGINTDTILEIAILRSIEAKLMDNLVTRGVESINNVTLRQELRGRSKEWLIDTTGSNIIDVMLHPEVDIYLSLIHI